MNMLVCVRAVCVRMRACKCAGASVVCVRARVCMCVCFCMYLFFCFRADEISLPRLFINAPFCSGLLSSASATARLELALARSASQLSAQLLLGTPPYISISNQYSRPKPKTE